MLIRKVKIGSLTRHRRGISVSSFALVLLLLVLPFATFTTCMGREEVTGLNLVASVPASLGHLNDPWAWAFMSFGTVPILALAGAAAQLWAGRRTTTVTLVTAGTGFLVLAFLGILFQLFAGGGWTWQPAFYFALACFIGPVASSVLELLGTTPGADAPELRAGRRVATYLVLTAVALGVLADGWYLGPSAILSTAEAAVSTWSPAPNCRLPVVFGNGPGLSGFVQIPNGGFTVSPADGGYAYMPSSKRWLPVSPEQVAPNRTSFVEEYTDPAVGTGGSYFNALRIVDIGSRSARVVWQFGADHSALNSPDFLGFIGRWAYVRMLAGPRSSGSDYEPLERLYRLDILAANPVLELTSAPHLPWEVAGASAVWADSDTGVVRWDPATGRAETWLKGSYQFLAFDESRALITSRDNDAEVEWLAGKDNVESMHGVTGEMIGGWWDVAAPFVDGNRIWLVDAGGTIRVSSLAGGPKVVGHTRAPSEGFLPFIAGPCT